MTAGDVFLGDAAALTHIRRMQIPDLLALRRAATEERLVRLATARSARRANPQSYPITLSYRYLTPQQQEERRETAQDVLRCIDEWGRSGRLSERQRAIHAHTHGQAAVKPRHRS